ncbi:hypothetical protein MHYP_G00280090 [Metynnis hypsauchen]
MGWSNKNKRSDLDGARQDKPAIFSILSYVYTVFQFVASSPGEGLSRKTQPKTRKASGLDLGFMPEFHLHLDDLGGLRHRTPKLCVAIYLVSRAGLQQDLQP